MVKQNFLFIAIIVLSLAAYSVVPTFAAPVSALNTNLPNSSSSSYTVTVSTNSSFYAGSQGIMVKGQISPLPPSGTSAGITVYNPNGTVVRVASAPVSSSTGDFSLSFTAGGTNWISGAYTVVASWAPSLSGPTYNGSASFRYAVMGFSMSLSEASISVPQGSAGSLTVALKLVTGTAEPVSLSVSGLPSGTSAIFTPASVTPSGSSTLTIAVGSSAPPGTYILSVIGTGGGMTVTSALGLTVIPTYTVTFKESGLPAGTSWSVTFNGVTSSSTASSISFTGVLAGTYSWSVTSTISMGSGTRYVAQTSSGTISVPATTSVSISYVEQYSVTVQSTVGGSTSPSGTSWYNAGSIVSITAIPASGYRFHVWLTSPSISISNSSLTSTQMTVKGPGTVTAQFVQVLTSTIVLNPASGAPGTTVQVSGSSFYPNSTVTVTYNGNIMGKVKASSSGSFAFTFTIPFLQNGTYTVKATDTMGDTASASFTESTIPIPGSSIVSSSSTAYIENGTAIVNQTTTVGVSVKIVNATVPNNYAVTVSVSKLSGLPTNVTPTTITASGYYDVKVTGLTSGMVQINITNPIISASNTNNELLYWNGTSWASALDVTVVGNTVSGYVPVSALSGTHIALVVTFPLTVTETGLPPGTEWSIKLNGTTYSSSTQSIKVSGLSPGTYSWSTSPTILISQGERAVASQASGSISVDSPSSFGISYVQQYLLSFESLPPNGGSTYPNMTEWVDAGSTISLVAKPSSGYKFVAWETNYSITFTNSSSATTTALVNSAGTIVAQFKAVPSYTMEYVAAAIVVVVIVIALAAVLLRRRK